MMYDELKRIRAHIYVDGNNIGYFKTKTVKVNAGIHTAEARAEGYSSGIRPITCHEGETVDVSMTVIKEGVEIPQ